MIVYRIERKKYLNATLLGVGASMVSGYRWNSLNTRMVYTAESRALATLEIAVHLDLSEDLPKDRYYVEIEIPDDLLIQEVSIEDLPDDWNAKPPMPFTQSVGDEFVNYNEAAVLKVPGSIVPDEFNYLINPLHQDIKHIRIIRTRKLVFDQRFKL